MDYLATVIDAHSCRVIDRAIDAHMRTDLIEDALAMAVTLRGNRRAQVIILGIIGIKPNSA